jgi:hypothetical protein
MIKITFPQTILLTVLSFVLVSNAHAFILVSDFDDGTLQGWSQQPIFNGTLTAPTTGGNPNGYMLTTDTMAAGGSLLALAPSTLTGNLLAYSGLQWDEFVFSNHGTTTVSTSVLIRGADGTVYQSDRSLGPIALWNTKSASFLDSSDWILKSGSASFNDVLANVDALFLSLDTSTLGNGNRESGIDNIGLLERQVTNVVPEPATMGLMGMGLIGTLFRKRKNLV